MHVVTCGRVLADDVDIPDRFSKYTQYALVTWPSPRRRCDIPDRFISTHSMHVVTCGRVLADDVDIPDRFSKYTQYACSHMWPSPRRRCGYT
ncbi:hypothetical protein J6590_029467 [Homalodisca vitripennis]|nr:hypothetical protein J6590_029467 [Homalodisca vitripennis]